MPLCSTPDLTTDRLVIRLPSAEDATRMCSFYTRNQQHLERWDPRHPAQFFTAEWWQQEIARRLQAFEGSRAAQMVLFLREEPEAGIVGIANLSNIVRGAFQACHLGYSIDGEREGQGLMHEALGGVLQWCFGEAGLHRIMANYQPANECSGVLLRRLAFVVEGYARDYLFLDGAWRDHILTALCAPPPN